MHGCMLVDRCGQSGGFQGRWVKSVMAGQWSARARDSDFSGHWSTTPRLGCSCTYEERKINPIVRDYSGEGMKDDQWEY